MADNSSLITKLRKRRGVVRASITRLASRLAELESLSDQPSTAEHAQQLTTTLEALNVDFKTHHFQLIDALTEDEQLEREQEKLDEHDDRITEFAIRLKRLATVTTPSSSESEQRKLSSRKLNHLEERITTARNTIRTISEDHDELDSSLLEQLQIQLSDYRSNLATIHTNLLSIDDQDTVRDQLETHSLLETALFESDHRVRKLLSICNSHGVTPGSTDVNRSGVKLPKIDVPTFNGNLLHWRQFWEQFCISVHDRSSLTDAEKLVYLQHALKDGSAKSIIEGLSQSGEQYSEAVQCLTSRFDRPRLIHQTHVKMILESPQLREGNGKELRKLHDTIQQHLRALKSMDEEPSSSFITSIIELKLDTTTMFEWQRHTQSQTDIPHYRELLEFLDHRAQASEISMPQRKQPKYESQIKKPFTSRTVPSYTVNVDNSHCPSCKTERHPLYSCSKFKTLPHERKMSLIKVNNLCMNCLSKGHFAADCKSLHRCRKCQNAHHTLLHVDGGQRNNQRAEQAPSDTLPSQSEVSVNAVVKLKSSPLLMTCRIRIVTPNGSFIEARALLDSASSASFISERIVQLLRLKCNKQKIFVSGIGGLSPDAPIQAITNFKISSCTPASDLRTIDVTAVVVPRVTCDLPSSPVTLNSKWQHLLDLPLADPEFGTPGRVDVLLGVDVFTNILMDGRRKGPPGSPIAMETRFGWVLCGGEVPSHHSSTVTTCHSLIETGDDLLRRFWEVEETPNLDSNLSLDERTVVNHFKANYVRKPNGRFMVPLPKKANMPCLGESRSQAVRRFMALERSLSSKNRFDEVDKVICEYFGMKHAEIVPPNDLSKPVKETFYLPIHAVYKRSSSTTKVRAVFDASAKSSTGISLNDLLLVGPTVHAPLIDVLLRFRLHPIALTADVSKMYRNIELSDEDKDLHRFVWRSKSTEPLQDYRMTRVTFGVSASSFAANMAVRQNATDFSSKYPLAAKVVDNSIYVDDCLTGADSIEDAISLHHQLLDLFQCGGFLLRKWNSSDPTVLQKIHPSVRDSQEVLTLSDSDKYTKALGLEWNTKRDHFHLTMNEMPSPVNITKRMLVSNVAKVFDVLGWFAPAIIKMKIILQRLWEMKVDWDDAVPPSVQNVWSQWKSELNLLSSHHIPRYYFPKGVDIEAVQLHGFSDASEDAYAGVVYLCGEDSQGQIYVSLVMAKTRVSPIKRFTIPRLELCGAHLLFKLIHHVREVYHIPTTNIHAWTDSTIVLNWLDGSPRRFKTYVSNRVSEIVSYVPLKCWNHVPGLDNPADCASRGVFPGELVKHELWWQGPKWLKVSPSDWPVQIPLPPNDSHVEEKEACLTVNCYTIEPVLPLAKYSVFSRFQRVTAWIFRFVNNCRPLKYSVMKDPCLSVDELSRAERYWLSIAQSDYFSQEISALQSNQSLPNKSALKMFNPFIDSHGLIRVGGRITNSGLSYSKIHPIILHSKHVIAKLLIRDEHHRLLHAGPSLVMSSIGLWFQIIGLRKAVRSMYRSCVPCRR